MSTAQPTQEPGQTTEFPLTGLFHLLVIYIIWGSTYLAIRVAVQEGSGFPPFSMAASRTLLGGGILLFLTGLRGRRLRLTRREFWILLASGVLLWVGGSGLVTWAETRADSGYAALVIATIPLWVAVIEAVIDRHPPTPLLVASLFVGLAGIGVLSWSQVSRGDARDVAAFGALMLAPVLWAGGTVLQRRQPVGVSPRVSAGYQQLFAGAVLILVALLTNEPAPQPAPDAMAAWVYLVIFGSVIAFSSYVAALRILPTRIVATYAYVNPVIAVILGAVVLDEAITASTLAGMVLVLLGVAGVFRATYRARPKPVPTPVR
ncbi:MAG TPA: EamA family transporter [Anaerolineales bacterium]|nr:EamA family transporter [Anaerolineales bacterium]